MHCCLLVICIVFNYYIVVLMFSFHQQAKDHDDPHLSASGRPSAIEGRCETIRPACVPVYGIHTYKEKNNTLFVSSSFRRSSPMRKS